jgi:nucleotide-binding universal stress UspA family protein
VAGAARVHPVASCAVPPTHGFAAKRILVPVNGSSTDEEAVRLACRFALRSRAKVYAVSILVVKRSLPLDAVPEADMERAERILDAAERVGRDLDVKVETELLQAREVGPAIVDEIRAWRADLLIMGMPYRERFGEFHVGKTGPYVMANAPCQVLIFREALREAEPAP